MKTAERIRNLPPYLFAQIEKKIDDAKKAGKDIISLGIGDPDMPTPEYIVDELCKEAKNPANHQYPSSQGLTSFREAVANWYKRRFGVELDPAEEVVSLIGSKEGIAHVPMCFTNPGDINLVPDPGYPVYSAGTLFAGGLGLHYGGEKMGAAVIPISGGNTKRQLMLMEDFGSTILACTPSYALYLAESLREAGIDRSRLKLRVGILGAEPWSDNMRQEIEEKFQIDAIDIYGLSEIMGPGVACECLEKKGLHVFEDHFIPEIIDPQNGRRLPPGELGELVFTTLTKEALPLIRYRTRDITRLIETECECGRTHVKIDRISGRTDDMLIIRGVNVFPSQIESVLLSIGEAEPHYQLIVDRARALDQLEIKVEVSEAFFSDEVRKLEALQCKIEREIEHVLGISVLVTLVEPKTIPRSEGKAQRIIDRRKL
jgi:phenylacetate-coenzyme A ligase PaaK-like adenylate-forming protein